MAVQPLTQGIELPAQFGKWLSETAGQCARPTSRPERFTAGEISWFEKYIRSVENLAGQCEWFVDFARQAGQDDDTARVFDEWTDEFGLLGVFNELERIGVAKLINLSADLVEIAEGWKRQARAGVIEPDLPPQLAERVARLDKRVREVTEQVTKSHDNDLIARLLMRVGKQRQLTLAEQFRLADAVRLDWKVKNQPSVRRADWYGDDGR